MAEYTLYPVGDKLLVTLRPMPEETPSEDVHSDTSPKGKTLPKLAKSPAEKGSLCCGTILALGAGTPNHGPDKTLNSGDVVLFTAKDAATDGYALVAFGDVLAKVK